MKEENRSYGYKAFYQDLTDKVGEKFYEGKTNYAEEGYFYEKKYLFCEKLEDALTFINSFENDIEIAIVSGENVNSDLLSKPFNGSIRYITSNLKIEKVLTRKEIIDMMLSDGEMDKFVSLYKLNDEEIEYIINNYDGLTDYLTRYIDKYQKGKKDAFVRTREY